MARGKRSRPREGAPEEELAASDFEKEGEGKRGSKEKAEGAADMDAREDDTGRELVFSECKAVLKPLMEHKHGWLFNEPVDPEKLEIPDYFSVVKHPMDLGTIEGKLDKKEYRDVALEFPKDVRLTFENAMRYNPPGHEVHNVAKKLMALFEKEWSKKKVTVVPTPKTPIQKASLRAFSFGEKQNLLENLQTLPPHMQHEAVLLITAKSPHVDWNSDEVEVQLDLMDNQALHDIDEHVRRCMKTASSEKKAKQSNKARSKVESQKGKNKPGDEEEDIGIVIDVPLSLFSPQKVK